jgi:NTE family protein
LRETLERALGGGYGPGATAPRLLVTAVDVVEGKLEVFDSLRCRVTAEHVVASGSLPPWFPPTAIDGPHGRHFYWDGGLWSNSPLPDVLKALRERSSPSAERQAAYRAYVIDVFPRRGRVPQTNWEVWRRINEIAYADKTDYDRRGADRVNTCKRLVQLMDAHKHLLPRAVADEIAAYAADLDLDHRFDVEVLKLQRGVYPSDKQEGLSREIDFSLPRIKELIAQGERDAHRWLEDIATQRPRGGGAGPSSRRRRSASPR